MTSNRSSARRLGMLVPSSNTVLEPTTATLLAELRGDVSLHAARFSVTKIDLGDASRSQFEPDPMCEAARLLADARVDVIAWNGTSAAWLGVERDRELCALIEADTGITATTTVLATLDALARAAAHRIALVTPYLPEIQERIVRQLTTLGFDVAAERHLSDPGNFSFSEYDERRVAGLVRDCVPARPDAVLIHCTNFRGAAVADTIEAESATLVLDSVSVTAWRTLELAGVDPARIEGWGRLFRL